MTGSSDSRPPLAYPPRDLAPFDPALAVRLADFEAPARERLHPVTWGYYANGAWDMHTLADTDAAWSRYRLRPRVLVDVSAVETRTRILGRDAALPIGVSPSALHGLAHPDGELATARAAAAAGALNVLSTLSSRTLEEVAEAAPDGRRWFQLYTQRTRAASRSLVERAAAAGYEAIVLTVDVPVLGYRDDLLRTGFDPGEHAFANLSGRDMQTAGGDLDDALDMRGVGLTWTSIAEIRSWSRLPLVIKGILTAEDAALAVEHGAAGVWVSTHGGRQLDRVPSSIDVLEEVVDAVGGRAEVYLDGGVRRGPDVCIALAVGATAVFTARPFLYALAASGQPGVERAFEILREEMSRALAILGTPDPAAVRREHVRAVFSAR